MLALQLTKFRMSVRFTAVSNAVSSPGMGSRVASMSATPLDEGGLHKDRRSPGHKRERPEDGVASAKKANPITPS